MLRNVEKGGSKGVIPSFVVIRPAVSFFCLKPK